MKIVVLTVILFLTCASLLFANDEPKEKKILLPIVLNLIPGLGIGSFTQGDVAGGVICLAGDLVGGGLAAFGVWGTFAYLATETATFTTYEGDWDFQLARTAIITGASIFLLSKTFATIRPIWYAGSYSRKLRKERVAFLPQLRYTTCTGKPVLTPGILIAYPLD